jgi:hypothetical protein
MRRQGHMGNTDALNWDLAVNCDDKPSPGDDHFSIPPPRPERLSTFMVRRLIGMGIGNQVCF